MKIVATIWKNPYNSDARFLAEINSGELHMIAGDSAKGADVGCTLNVRAVYQMLRDVDDSTKRLKGAASTLRALADLCDQQTPSLIAPEEPTK